MILGIDHVGVATEDPAGAARYLSALGLRPGDRGVAEQYRVACEFWQPAAAGGAAEPAIELVSPVGEGSAVRGRLDRYGPGIYHVAFRVDDVAAELARLRGAGFVAVDEAPCGGARPGMRVAFVYAARPAGLLVELVEYADAAPR